jgi:hypothetical protein
MVNNIPAIFPRISVKYKYKDLGFVKNHVKLRTEFLPC